jgi:hypothetical protein
VKYIWLIIMLIIIVRSIVLQRKRTESRGTIDAPREDLSFDAEELYLESSPAREPGESGPGLSLPEYPAGRGGKQEPAKECRAGRGSNIDSGQELRGRCGGPELFDGGIGQREFIKGMVWSQILGPRGGIQASKRFRYR